MIYLEFKGLGLALLKLFGCYIVDVFGPLSLSSELTLERSYYIVLLICSLASSGFIGMNELFPLNLDYSF